MPIIGSLAGASSRGLGGLYYSILEISSSFDSIDSAVATSNQLAFEFTSIPNTYKHLRLHITARSTRGFSNGDLISLKFNDSSSGYYDYTMYGSNVTSDVALDNNFNAQDHIDIRRVPGSTADANMYAGFIIDIMDYASSSKVKSLISKGGVAAQLGQESNQAAFVGAWWNSTTAINKISVRLSYGENFVAGSSVSLYGLKG